MRCRVVGFGSRPWRGPGPRVSRWATRTSPPPRTRGENLSLDRSEPDRVSETPGAGALAACGHHGLRGAKTGANSQLLCRPGGERGPRAHDVSQRGASGRCTARGQLRHVGRRAGGGQWTNRSCRRRCGRGCPGGPKSRPHPHPRLLRCPGGRGETQASQGSALRDHREHLPADRRTGRRRALQRKCCKNVDPRANPRSKGARGLLRCKVRRLKNISTHDVRRELEDELRTRNRK